MGTRQVVGLHEYRTFRSMVLGTYTCIEAGMYSLITFSLVYGCHHSGESLVSVTRASLYLRSYKYTS